MKISYKAARNFCVGMQFVAMVWGVILMSMIDASSIKSILFVFSMMVLFFVGSRLVYLCDVQPKRRQNRYRRYVIANC